MKYIYYHVFTDINPQGFYKWIGNVFFFNLQEQSLKKKNLSFCNITKFTNLPNAIKEY